MATNNKEISAAFIERVKKGDTHAFKKLVERYKTVSLSLACSILKDEEKAEDILQDAFLKVFLKIKDFQYQSAFSTWLYRIVVNTSYNALKRDKTHERLSELSPEESLVSDKSALQTLKEEDQRHYVILALNKIRSDESLILRLFYLCDLSLIEISQITGFSRSKIKVDLYRGRKNIELALKELLGHQLNDLL